MHGILYEENSVWLFLLVSVVMGGWAAWRSGVAVARTWKPVAILGFYMLLLGAAVRFIHSALFEGTLFSLQYYLVDTVIVTLIAYLGWRHARAEAMARQYAFAFERHSPFGWRRKPSKP